MGGDSILKTSQTREGPLQAEWILHPHNAERRREARGTHCCQETCQTCQRPPRDTPCQPGGVGVGGSDQKTAHGENAAAFAYMTCTVDPEDTCNKVQFKLLITEFAHATWSQPNTDSGDCRTDHSWTEQWLCNLETGALLLIISR